MLVTRVARDLDDDGASINTRAMTIIVSAFYKFVSLTDCDALAARLRDELSTRDIKGTVLLAGEGINATISGAEPAIDAFLQVLRRDPRFADLTDKRAQASDRPFQKLKVKVKPEIVTFGVPDADPARDVGTYVAPDMWNALISDPNVIVVDTRNTYEVQIGSFPGARNPGTERFSDFPEYVRTQLSDAKDKPIAMFCTGGIRCEKASAYLLTQGFTSVFHLEGGILKYLENVPKPQSMWHGECFVFDARVALDHGVVEGSHALCPGCGTPVLKVAEQSQSDTSPSVCARCGAKS